MENSILIGEGQFNWRWWAVLLRGLLAIVFGVAAFTWPGVTLATLVFLFGWYALADGVSLLIAVIFGKSQDHRWLLASEAVISIWAGVVILRAPAVTALFLTFFISIWAMATGFLRIVEAIRVRKKISGELWLVLSGVLSILFALGLMARPVAGALSLVWVLAGFSITLGVLWIILGIELRGIHAAH